MVDLALDPPVCRIAVGEERQDAVVQVQPLLLMDSVTYSDCVDALLPDLLI